MNVDSLFFHIYYCNGRRVAQKNRYLNSSIRILQHHEIILFSGGRGYCAIDGKRYPIKGGALFYVRPGVPFSIDACSEIPFSFFSVHFSYAHVSFNNSQWDVTSETKALPLPVGQELQDSYQIEDIFKRLVDTWNAKQPGYEFVAKTALQQLLIALAQSRRKESPNYALSLRVEKIIRYMHQHVERHITLRELADLVQLSPFYLSRTFKEATGYTIVEYFNKIKIDAAKELLIEGDRKVKEVAQSLGFTDEFYFSRIFKKVEGISPSEYHSKNIHGL